MSLVSNRTAVYMLMGISLGIAVTFLAIVFLIPQISTLNFSDKGATEQIVVEDKDKRSNKVKYDPKNPNNQKKSK